MKKYIIDKLFVDGYERIIDIRGVECDVSCTVHFLEYDEYLTGFEQSQRKHIGDIIEGNLFIDLVTISEKVDLEMMHQQGLKDSSHIEAIVEVCEVKDDYSIYANSTIINDNILIEFEDIVDYSVGDKIRIEGSLEIDEADIVKN
jgi:hypothetical protein